MAPYVAENDPNFLERGVDKAFELDYYLIRHRSNTGICLTII